MAERVLANKPLCWCSSQLIVSSSFWDRFLCCWNWCCNTFWRSSMSEVVYATSNRVNLYAFFVYRCQNVKVREDISDVLGVFWTQTIFVFARCNTTVGQSTRTLTSSPTPTLWPCAIPNNCSCKSFRPIRNSLWTTVCARRLFGSLAALANIDRFYRPSFE